MPFINDLALDAACNWFITNVTRMDICSQEPTNYTEATSTYTLGNKTGLTMTGPTNGTPDGRAATVPTVADGTTTSNGTASHWAITKPTATTALGASGSLSASKAVSTLVDWSSNATFDVTFRDPS